MALYDRDFLTTRHTLYEDNIKNWEFYIRSFLGGNDYKNGYNLHRYILETPEEYDQRIRHTPIDNHCRNVVQIYSVLNVLIYGYLLVNYVHYVRRH